MSRIFCRPIDRIADCLPCGAGLAGLSSRRPSDGQRPAATSYCRESLLTNSRTERHDLLSISPEMLQSHALAFLQNRIDVFGHRRRPPKTSSRRDPGTTSEIIRNRSAGRHARVVGDVEPLAAPAKGNHFNVAEISTGGAARQLPDSRIAEIDEHTSQRSPLGRKAANCLPSSPAEDQFPILPVASR